MGYGPITEEKVWWEIDKILQQMIGDIWGYHQMELTMSLISISQKRRLNRLHKLMEFAETLPMHKGNILYMMAAPVLESDKMHREIRRKFESAKTEEERKNAPAEWYKFIGIR